MTTDFIYVIYFNYAIVILSLIKTNHILGILLIELNYLLSFLSFPVLLPQGLFCVLFIRTLVVSEDYIKLNAPCETPPSG